MDKLMNYQKIQVTTADRLKLVVMLYDGAISFLKTAKKYLEENDMAAKGIYISKAQDIIDELNNSLNLKQGGEIAITLRKIYNFLYFYLVKANLKKDPKMIQEVIDILSSLREAWFEISKRKENEKENEEENYVPDQKVELSGDIRI